MKDLIINLSYRKKLMLLGIGAFVFALIAYALSIKKTVTIISEYYSTKDVLESNINSAEQVSSLQSKLSELERYFGVNASASDNFHETLLETVSVFCNENKLVLRNFPEAMVYNSGEFSVETDPVIVKGGYINLVKLIYELEQKNKVGNIASVSFETIVDSKTKTKSLILKIYVQNISKIKTS
ncbi:MAG: hypothetical protein AB7G44_08385 [Bacteroidia bacterium]